ncbi:MAG: hypothetical protein N2606_02265 [Candidatus Omnitrophica bacterium]|nr:hypothetical protein [Candidatus Omnitrophota bacterium]
MQNRIAHSPPRKIIWQDAQTSIFYAIVSLLVFPIGLVCIYLLNITWEKVLLFSLTAISIWTALKALLYALNSFLRTKEFTHNFRYGIKATFGFLLGLVSLFLDFFYLYYWIYPASDYEIKNIIESLLKAISKIPG